MKHLIIGFAIFIIGCNTLPVGSEQMRDLPETSTIELIPESLDTYARFVPLGFADYLLLGKDNQYESRVLINFSLADSSLDSVTSVQLILYPLDSTPMNFICRACSTEWATSGVTWWMADSTNRWMRPGGDYWAFTLGQGRLEKDSTIVELNRQYLNTLVRNSYGIIIFPSDTGFTSIATLAVTKTSPRIVFTYADGKKRTYYASEDAHIIDSLDIRINPGELIVGSGVAFRTWLWFALESIPDSATIARAELSFKPQTLYYRSEKLWIGIHRLTESYSQRGKYTAFEKTPSARSSYVPKDGDSVIKFEISGLIQKWASYRDSCPNYGMLLTAEPENLKPFRIKIFRSGPSAPRLKIHYILPPSDRFTR